MAEGVQCLGRFFGTVLDKHVCPSVSKNLMLDAMTTFVNIIYYDTIILGEPLRLNIDASYTNMATVRTRVMLVSNLCKRRNF
jgi:hypothetical protein